MESTRTIALPKLRSRPTLIRCPVCGQVSTTLISRVHERLVHIIFDLLTSAVFACILLPFICHVVYSVTHACQHCGLRLAISTGPLLGHHTRVHAAASDASPPGSAAVPSPLGFMMPADLAAALLPYGTRFAAVQPVRFLHVALNGAHNLPSAVLNPAGRCVFQVESPGIPQPPPNLPSVLARPHFRVSAVGNRGWARELVRLQLFGIGYLDGGCWDVVLHVPQRIAVGGGGGQVWPGQGFVERKVTAPDVGAWTFGEREYREEFLWWSSEGRLLWVQRVVVDGEGVKGRFLCLFDAYDRLLAIIRPGSTKWNGVKLMELRLYADLGEQLITEILATYTALKVQQRRIVEIRAEEADD